MDLDDERLERRLTGLRPVRPPASLRARVIASARQRRTRATWIWLPAAAMIVIAFVSWRTGRIYRAVVEPQLAIADVERQAEVDRLSRAWGDTPASRAAATDALKAIDDASHGTGRDATVEGSIR